MPKITDAKREARRQQILDAALRCFSRDGFHNTTTADIVRESGVSQGTLYLYFANKDEIIVAQSDDRHQREAFLNALAQREQDPVRGLFTLIELHGAGLVDASLDDVRRVGVQGWAEALRDPLIKSTIVQGADQVREAIVQLIARGQRTGQIRASVDPDAVARTLIAIFRGFVLQLAWGETVDGPACGGLLRAMIRDTLLTPEGQTSFDAMTAAYPC